MSFSVADITCLVGKNEAGKTALLKALYRLNPFVEGDGQFDVTNDYPRQLVSDYEEAIESGQEHSVVVRAVFALGAEDIEKIRAEFGPLVFDCPEPTITLSKGYSNTLSFSLDGLSSQEALRHVAGKSEFPPDLSARLQESLSSLDTMLTVLSEAEQTQAVQELTSWLQVVKSKKGLEGYVYSLLQGSIPKFLYFDEYYQLTGQENLEALIRRHSEGSLQDSDYPLLGLIGLAGLQLDNLTSPGQTRTLLSKLEAASNKLSQTVLKHWTQNKHLGMKFDVRPALPEDPPGMTSGTNLWGLIENRKHMVTTELGTRSRGFLWFFSFLSWYSDVRRKNSNLILLLDEPGLTLHGKAQEDLLRYFEEELQEDHQLMYTTHSPFMIYPTRFDRVRIVQDLSVSSDDDLPPEKEGTKVITEVLDATQDSLFPLQGALGYEIYQTLFVGPDCLVVEGVSDLLYLQTLSSILEAKEREGLSKQWTITPVGGSDKVPTFVALLGSQSTLNVAVLLDYQKKDQQKIEDLYKRKLLRQSHVFAYGNFLDGENRSFDSTSVQEADIEDMFEVEFYLSLVNAEFGSDIEAQKLSLNRRIVSAIEQHLESHPLPGGAAFNHYRPARYFADKISDLEGGLSSQILDQFEQMFKTINRLLDG